MLYFQTLRAPTAQPRWRAGKCLALFPDVYQSFLVARSFGTHSVITANLTDDGAPVYLTATGKWSPSLTDAIATADEDELLTLLTAARGQERVVCDPYAFKVVLEDGTPTATTTRERIRAAGPTTPIRRPDAAHTRAAG